MKYEHIPVMLGEVLEHLSPRQGEFFVDCTLGGGGYTFEIARLAGERGRVLAIDLDELAINNAKQKIKIDKNKNIILAHDNFKNLSKIVEKYFQKEVRFNGIVFDLGLSSAQLQDRTRGFSFRLDAPLDMAFGHEYEEERINTITTEFIINKWGEEGLVRIIKEYGEERSAGRIAREIVKAREGAPIKTTGQLAEIIKKAIPKKFQRGKIHPATRTFQALRIATNNELDNLEKVLPQAVDLLAKGGRVAVISYHSLEDRIIKNFFKKEGQDCICPPEIPECRCEHRARLKIITKKVVVPSLEEIKNNPRARSAKMRVAEKI